MTGFGDARGQNDRLSMSVEVRAVNNRYFKLVTKTPERYQFLEGEIERVVRDSDLARHGECVGPHRRRRCRDGLPARCACFGGLLAAIDAVDLLAGRAAAGDGGKPAEPARRRRGGGCGLRRPARGLAADRVVAPRGAGPAAGVPHGRRAPRWSGISQTNRGIVATELEKIALRAPQIVRDFRDKLHERVAELLRDGEASVQPSDLIREVSIYAERCDISEEILRLRSHIDQFQSFVAQPQSAGRKLDFLTQEMVREVNTIGSKANNVEVAHSVVEIKAAIERMREVLQNVE